MLAGDGWLRRMVGGGGGEGRGGKGVRGRRGRGGWGVKVAAERGV